tara:strand:- start:86 stop:1018 length:933 start_codon:yes stop_codon:yes gene_type:complete
LKTILITGGAGFIGQNLVKHFQKKYKVFIIDNFSSKGVRKKYLFNNKNVIFIKDDISNFSNAYKKLRNIKVDYLIHAAAHFANENSIINPDKDLKTNILGTLNILEYSRKKRIKKFIYLSSSCVYGERSFAKEEDTINPVETPYAASKYSAELYVQFFKNFHKLNTSIVRVFNTYGPGELNHKYRNVIPRFIDNALKNKNLIITGTGNETRDFTFIDDLVKILDVLIKSKNIPNIINSCTGIKTKTQTLANIIIKLTKSKSKIKFLKLRNWDRVKNRLGSTKKINKILNIQKFTNLKDGLRETIEWFKDY